MSLHRQNAQKSRSAPAKLREQPRLYTDAAGLERMQEFFAALARASNDLRPVTLNAQDKRVLAIATGTHYGPADLAPDGETPISAYRFRHPPQQRIE